MFNPNIGGDFDLTELLAAGLSPETAYITMKYVRQKEPIVRRSALNDPGKAAEWAHAAIVNAWERRILSTDKAKGLLIEAGFDAEAHRLELGGPRPRRNIFQRIFDRIRYG